MEDKLRFQDRRNSIRLKIVSPVVYTQFDNRGRAYETKPSKTMNISSGGGKLKSSFPVKSGELLEITIALGPKMVTFKGKVIYATPSDDQGFESGISIEEIENQDRIALARFVIQKCREKESEALGVSQGKNAARGP